MPPYSCFSQNGITFPSPWGPRQNGWDHLTPDRPSGIWGMVLSLCRARPTRDVSSLDCVYLLAPCRENLPINCMLILSVNYPTISCCCLSSNHHLSHLTNSPTTPLHSSSSYPSLWHFALLLFTSAFIRCCHAPPSPKYIHINT